MTKYIFVTGGVVSGTGKKVSAASIGRSLKGRGFSVPMQKFDPCLNIDPGAMSPYQHGEVFVTKDGVETDLDLGHYERSTDEELTKRINITTGKIYLKVINKEHRRDYDGKTVQVIPRMTGEIRGVITEATKESSADVVITEIGGTIGDIESLPFIEATRQVHSEHPKGDVAFIHTVLVSQTPGSDELKTKSTRHSYRQLMNQGIRADVVITRSDGDVDEPLRNRIFLFCSVPPGAMVQSERVNLIYEVPLVFRKQKLDDYILKLLNLEAKENRHREWKGMIDQFKKADQSLTIGLVGKYVQLHDAYLSVAQALMDTGYKNGAKVHIQWIDSGEIEKDGLEEHLKDLDSIIVPGDSGDRGVEGMIATSQYTRENRVPYFGICPGIQIAVLDIAHHLCNPKGASSSEQSPGTNHPVIDLTESQISVESVGGTLHLGNYSCHLLEGSLARGLYGQESVEEYHRHRHELNNDFRGQLRQGGLIFSGIHEGLDLAEVMELRDYPFSPTCQFHPEFKSKSDHIHPLFSGFIQASLKNKK